MNRALISSVLCLAAFGAAAGANGVKLDASADRVESPLRVNLNRVGTLVPRGADEIKGETSWRLGCETLDRDYIDFDEYREFVAPLGIKLVRLQGGWAKCEKEKGKYDFSWLDHIVDYLAGKGVECAIETSYGNPIYPGGGTVDLAAGFPKSEAALSAWDAWVGALAKHFKGRVNRYMMWNEPDIRPMDGSPAKTPSQIAAFNVRTARAILKECPDAKIAGLSLARNDPAYFEECVKALGDDAKLFTWFIYHGYAPAPESVYADVERMKAITAKYAPHVKLWQGENGCPSEMSSKFALSRIAWSEYSQAKWDMRRMLGDLGHDVLSSVFTICDFSHTGREINLKGLLRANEQKEVIAVKRAYYAVQNVVAVFDDRWTRVKDAAFCTTDASITSYHYIDRSGTPLFVFWTHGDDWKQLSGNSEACVLGEGTWALEYRRPGDSFTTRPAVFKYSGKPLVDPVWVDLFTGHVYEFPKSKQLMSHGTVRFIDVPVYDSPCLITERSSVIK